MKKALITGVAGQDGSYLAEFLLNKGYEVHGVVRRSSTFNRGRIDHLHDQPAAGVPNKRSFILHYGDITDTASLLRILEKSQPDEVYNLAAQSHVQVSFETPVYTAEVTGLGTLKLLDVLRTFNSEIKVYQAGSSEMFGKVQEAPQTETTPFHPQSPYGVAKVFSHHVAVNYRDAYDMFISNGILFNHESPRRGENFVTRKITLGAAAIKLGLRNKLVLGNLEAKRDWGYAKDYVEAMWLMLQQSNPDDFVIATGQTCSVRDFCKMSFEYLDLNYQDFVETDSRYYRPTEVDELCGNPEKAKKVLGWEPKTDIKSLVEIMVDADIEYLKAKAKS